MAVLGSQVITPGSSVGGPLDIQLDDNVKLYFGTGSDSCIYYDGSDTFWDLQAVGSGGLLLALGAGFPSPDRDGVHIWKASAGAVTADVSALLTLENDTNIFLQFLSPSTTVQRILFDSEIAGSRGTIEYNHAVRQISLVVDNAARLRYVPNSFNFQEATAITTTSGNLTLNPTDDVAMGSGVFLQRDTAAIITASTTQAQGEGALTNEINEVAVVAFDNDTVTTPFPSTGRTVTIINNGANTLQIFPFSGTSLGKGTDVSEQLEANEVVTYVAYDTANWKKASSTEIIHAEIHDDDNTDAFVINDAGADFHSYHTNGLAAGDLAGWTFVAGGAGTSFPIASIADGAASGVDIAVTTTGSHGLATGDIISQTNLADAAYVGIFTVKAIISATIYEVAAVFTTTGTGTVDQAATLIAGVGAAGVYQMVWGADATTVSNNETFDFRILNGTTVVVGSKSRIEFGTGAKFSSFGKPSIFAVADGDKISFALSNEDSAGNITIRDITITLVRL